jgi:DNA modification methylase
MIKLLVGDACNLDIESNSVDMIITHPPYLGVDTLRYGGDSSKQINQSQDKKKMLKLLGVATREMFRVLKPGGHLVIAIGAVDNIDMEYVTDAKKIKGSKYLDFICQNSYSESNVDNQDRIMSNSIITWHHFIKDGDAYYNPYITKRYRDPVWNLPVNNLDSTVDTLIHRETNIVDTMNVEIPKRFIEMFSKKNATVLDPFGGSALVAVTAVELGRRGISNDISEDQNKAAEQRVLLTLGEKHVRA